MAEHFNKGNKHAEKPENEKALSWLQVRVKREKKAEYVRSLYKDEKLSEFVLMACDNELKKRNNK